MCRAIRGPSRSGACFPRSLGAGDTEGPSLAVVATSEADRPELVLFTTRAASREEVNRAIGAAGLSPLHYIRRVIELEAIPVLGTGKTDYRTLQERLTAEGFDPRRNTPGRSA